MNPSKLNTMADMMRQASRYLDEISYLPELNDPFNTHFEFGHNGPKVTVYLPASRNQEEQAVDRLRSLAVQLGGRLFLDTPVANRPGTFRALKLKAVMPFGGLLCIWSPIAHVDPAPAEPVSATL